jgi:hypothetical protein
MYKIFKYVRKLYHRGIFFTIKFCASRGYYHIRPGVLGLTPVNTGRRPNKKSAASRALINYKISNIKFIMPSGRYRYVRNLYSLDILAHDCRELAELLVGVWL